MNTGPYDDLLRGFNGADFNNNGVLNFSEAEVAQPGLSLEAFNELDANGDGVLTVGEVLAVNGPGILHNADLNGDGVIRLSELVRVIQFYNVGGYACAANAGATEDGYVPLSFSSEAQKAPCSRHASDYDPADGVIQLTELLRLIQLFNAGRVGSCPSAEDGFCVVTQS
jgi:hypothetical protein